MKVYVLTMVDSCEDYNNGVFNSVFGTMEKAVEQWNRWMEDEVEDGVIAREDLVIDSVGCSHSKGGRFFWTIDEKGVI